jgi:hypothetical protein
VFHHLIVVVTVLLSVFAACTSAPRYTITATPLSSLNSNGPGICLAVDQLANRVWWWEPGHDLPGCSGRSTGPDLFLIPEATVTPSPSGGVEIHFQLGLRPRGVRDLRLILHGGVLRDLVSGQQVAVERRKELNIPGFLSSSGSAS